MIRVESAWHPASPQAVTRAAPPAAAAAPDFTPPAAREQAAVTLSLGETARGPGIDLAYREDPTARRLREAAKIDHGRSMREALDEALEHIRWLLKAMGGNDKAAGNAKAALRDKVHGDLMQRMQGGAGTVEVGDRQSLTLEIRSLEITIQQGGSTVQVQYASLNLDYRRETTVRPLDETVLRQVDPLVLDLAGNGIRLTPPDRGPSFDIDGDGSRERTAWVEGDDALLARDRDGDGAITSGRELFGQANGGADGFDELARLDGNGDRVIDAKDEGYGALLLLREGGRLDNLAEAGIARIRLDAVLPLNVAAGGGTLVAGSLFERADGSTGAIHDALFDVMA